MKDLQTIPITRAQLTCQHCFAETDKTASIEQMRSQMKIGHSGEQAALVARCIACETEILVLISADGKVEAVDIDPYKDVEEKAVCLAEIASPPSAKCNEEAFSRYHEGAKSFEDGNYVGAYACWRVAHTWFSRQPESSTVSCGLLSNMGMALSRMHNTTEALRCFESALSGMDQAQSPDEYATVLNNIGAACLHLGMMEKAENYHRQAYELHLKAGSDGTLLLRERDNLAFAYAKSAWKHFRGDDLARAIESARCAAALFADSSPRPQGSSYFLKLGNLLCRRGDQLLSRRELRGALQAFEEALGYHQKAEAPTLVLLQDADRVSETNRRLGRIEEALKTMRQSDELRETLSKAPANSLTMLKRRGPTALAMRQIGKRLLSFFSRSQSTTNRKLDEPQTH